MISIVKSKEDLNRRIADAGGKLIVLDFFANWCGPCNLILPKLEELANFYFGRAIVLKIDVDDNEEITTLYNVSSLPTFVFIKCGKVVNIFTGSNSDELIKTIEKYVDPKLITPGPVQQQAVPMSVRNNAIRPEETNQSIVTGVYKGPTYYGDDRYNY